MDTGQALNIQRIKNEIETFHTVVNWLPRLKSNECQNMLNKAGAREFACTCKEPSEIELSQSKTDQNLTFKYLQ